MNKYLLVAGVAMALTACSDSHHSVAPRKGQVYRVVTEDVKPPLIVYAAGKPTGFEYELLEAIAAKQGITFQYQVSPRANLLTSLEDGQADIAAGAMTITEQRQQKVDFSDPILDYVAAVLVVPALADVKSMAELKGKKIASRKDIVYEQMVIDYLSTPSGDNVRYYDSAWLQVNSLLTGEREVMLGDNHILAHYVQEHGQDKVVFAKGLTFPQESYGFAVKKGNTALQKTLNQGLAAVRADGTYDRIAHKYWKPQ